ncbi:MAG: radical SAM protein [Phycisphaerales bacterium]|nr:radical SAM protein [Phycisphaerales bacterium]
MNNRVREEINRRRLLEKERAQRLGEWAQGNEAGPFKLMFFPTNTCNLECAICWQRKGVHDYSELSAKRQVDLIDEAIEIGVREFVIGGGGEPLMRWKTLRPLFEKIRAADLYGMLFTNGTLIGSETAANLVDMKWNKVLISLDGLKESNDCVRTAGSFDRIAQGIQCLLDKRGNRSLPVIGVGCVLTRQSIRDLPHLMDFLGKQGCDQLNLIRLVVYTESQREYAVTPTEMDELQGILESSQKTAASFGMVTNLAEYMDGNIIKQAESFEHILLSDRTLAAGGQSFWNSLCFEPFSNMVVHSNGMVGPCCMSGDASLESLVEQSLADVWYGEKFSSLRQGILSRCPESYCRICDINVFAENQRLRALGGSL